MNLIKSPLPRLGLGVILALLMGGMWLLPAGAASADSGTPIAVPIPAIPGVAPLPGPVADAATPSQTMGILKVTPEQGVTGSPMTISGSGLQANTEITLTWSTADVTWVLDPQPETVDYHGRSVAPVAVVIKKVTTNAGGAFTVTLNAPDDWGGIHDIYAVVNGKQVAHGGFLIARSFTISPKSGSIGTPITITYRGLGSSLYEGGASLLYDNHYTGAMMANWTRGTARVVIRAAGPIGKHTIQVGDAITYLYMNIQQAPVPWAVGFSAAFTVTRDNGRPKNSLDWPVSVTPTVSQLTTLESAGDTAGSTAHLRLASTAGAVKSIVGLTASGLASDAPVSLVWSTVVGNRVNCKGTCWTMVSVPLGQVTPAGGAINTKITVPDGLGGWHVVQIIQGGSTVAQVPYFVKESIVGRGVSSVTVKEGQPFTVHMKGVGWTQLDNTRAVTYDNSYIGYGCGFNSQGDVVFNLHATGVPGTHLIDIYPMLYTQQPSFANTPYGMIPVLTYARDFPGLALGYQLPAARLAITVVK
jgi:hypothetical protein